jgi:tRNA(Ile)-lysidine synthase
MNHDTLLFTAHHQNDQAETIILRLLRASGVRGLASIPPVRPLAKGKLIRPLLALSKTDLQAYAEQQDLQWVEDESNNDLVFDRNFIRHQIIPKLTERWPQAVKQLARSAGNCRDEQSLLNELAAIDVAAMQSNNVLSALDILAPIELSILTTLSLARQRNVLQYLLCQLVDYPVSQSRLNEWLMQLKTHTRENNSVLQLETLSLAVYDGQMYFLRPTPDMSSQEINWKIEKPIKITTLSSTLSAKSYAEKASADELTVEFSQENTVRVHWRQGGERVQLKGEPFTRSYKKLLQERRIAPWLRNALPLVSIGGHIVWSAALGDFSPTPVNSTGNYIKFNFKKNKSDST